MAAADWGVEPAEKFWFNTKTGAVEYGKLTAAAYRLGPFESEAEAALALEKLAARAAAWAAEEAEED